MDRFEPITFVYDGKEYVVEPDRVWGLIKTIEDHISFVKLARRLGDDDPPEMVVAEAYRSALRYAGCRNVSAQDLQMETTGEERMSHAFVLLQILSLTQPQFQKKQQAGKAKTPKKSTKAKG